MGVDLVSAKWQQKKYPCSYVAVSGANAAFMYVHEL